MATIQDIISTLEQWAPRKYQESYDNAGLIVGDPNQETTGILVCLDSTEEVVSEAISRKCNLIIAHHPIVFSGLKSITGRNYVERTIIKAIKNDIAIYAIHTNLDNIISGVNYKIADKLNLINRKVLIPKEGTLFKLSFYCPKESQELVTNALHKIGGGHIGNYDHCSFSHQGEGKFRPLEGSNPYVGSQDAIHIEAEFKVDIIIPSHLTSHAIATLEEHHPYEEVAYFIQPLSNVNPVIGTGMIGELKEAMDAKSFLNHLKTTMQTECIRHTALVKEEIKKVAVVGGSGSFALQDAIRQQADIFITGDFKYHEFFDAENHLIIADIGHYESEQFTISLLVDYLKKKLPNFAVLFTEVNTNPVKYL